MEAIRQARIRRSVKVGDVIIENLLGLGVDVVATREVA
jgi:CxxC motif-containing protein